MKNSILDFLGASHASHIHARGRLASLKMMEFLDCHAGERVLEFGFGTGASLVDLAANHPDTLFYGVEASEIMHRKGSDRIRFCGFEGKIQLFLTEHGKPLPLKDGFFDRVYVESVLAIQEGEELRRVLKEIHRILKPGGTLVMNETIWLDSTPQVGAKEINGKCKKAFGIIQANSTFPHLRDWKLLLEDCGLSLESSLKVSHITRENTNTLRNRRRFLSRLFTAYGKAKSRISPSLQREWRIYQSQIRQIIPPDAALMEGVLFKACKQ